MLIPKGAFGSDETTNADTDALRPRATRLPLRVPVVYRAVDHDGWHHAWTVNVSRSGVLLEFDPLPDHPATEEMEFVIGLSSGRELLGVHNVRCHGRIVRSERAARAGRVAVTIDQYQYAAADEVFGGAKPFPLD